MTNDQVYWQRYESAASISVLNPALSGVRIDAVAVLHGREHDEHAVHAVLPPESKYMMRLPCPDIGCNNSFIDISNEIYNAVKSGKTAEGTKRCSGHIGKYAHNRSSAFDCEAYVKYRIEPILRTEY